MASIHANFSLEDVVARIQGKCAGVDVGKKPKFITGDAFKYLYMVKHLRYAVVALVLNELIQLDPAIGDASCEVRVLLIIWLRQIYLTVADDGDRKAALDYLTAHANDKPDTQVRTLEDAKGAEDPKACDALFARVLGALTQQQIDVLRGCYTFTSTSVMSKDEVGLLFANRSTTAMMIAGEDALISGNEKHLINVEKILKANFARGSIELYIELYRKVVPRHEAVVPNVRQYFIENQLELALEKFKSRVSYKFEFAGQAEIVEMPLRAIFPLLASHTLMAFNMKGGGILTRTRLAEMHDIPGAAGKHLYNDVFVDAYVLLWKPNKVTGRWQVVDINSDNLDEPYTVLDGWTKFLAGGNGQGLDASNPEEHEAAFKEIDLTFAVDQYAAGHPDFTCIADEKNLDYEEGFNKLCMPQPAGVKFTATREDFPALNLNTHRPGEVRPNMLDRFRIARKWAEKRGLHDDCQPINGTSVRELYVRLGRPVDWQIEHIYASTPRQLLADTAALKAKFAKAPNHKLGPHIIRAGEGAYSFEKIEDAQAVLKLKGNKRKAEYIKRVPENAPFVT